MKTKIEVQTRNISRKATDAERLMTGTRFITIGQRYVVKVHICEGMVSDGMWTTIQHAAVFADRQQAEQLAARVGKAMRDKDGFRGLDMTKWIWHPSVTQAFAILQTQPVATEYMVG